MNVPSGEKNGDSARVRLAEARRRARLGSRRWLSLGASIAAGVLVGTWLSVGGSRNPWTADVLEHLEEEPEALAASARRETAAAAAEVLADARIRLRPEAGRVAYAKSCSIRGRTGLHLVLESEGGPVTVLVLRQETVATPVRFTARGFSGRIEPSGPGSVAVVVPAGADLDDVTARVLAAVQWL